MTDSRLSQRNYLFRRGVNELDQRGPWFHVPQGRSCPATGTLGSVEFSQITKSSLKLLPAGACTHWPPTKDVATTLAFGPLPQCRCPTGVSTSRVLIALARAVLSLGSDAAFKAAAAASNSARLGPSCWVHCLPIEVW